MAADATQARILIADDQPDVLKALRTPPKNLRGAAASKAKTAKRATSSRKTSAGRKGRKRRASR